MCNGGVEAIWWGHEAKSFFLAGAWAQFYKKQRGLKQKYIYRVYKPLKRQVYIFNSYTQPLSQIEYLALARINCYKSEHFPKTEANINVNMWYVSLAQSSFHIQLLSSLVSSSQKVDNTIRATVLGCPLAEAAFFSHFIIILVSEAAVSFVQPSYWQNLGHL
jgi:hypothetical protein